MNISTAQSRQARRQAERVLQKNKTVSPSAKKQQKAFGVITFIFPEPDGKCFLQMTEKRTGRFDTAKNVSQFVTELPNSVLGREPFVYEAVNSAYYAATIAKGENDKQYLVIETTGRLALLKGQRVAQIMNYFDIFPEHKK